MLKWVAVAEMMTVAVWGGSAAMMVFSRVMLKRYGRPAFVDYGNPDFAMLAESFGCRGYRVTAAQELVSVLEDAFHQPIPSVISCPVDYSENMKLSEKLGAWVCPA
jgi:acetolactate synthase I/II/III large subunit